MCSHFALKFSAHFGHVVQNCLLGSSSICSFRNEYLQVDDVSSLVDIVEEVVNNAMENITVSEEIDVRPFTDDDLIVLGDLAETIAEQNYDIEDMRETLARVEQNVSNSVNEANAADEVATLEGEEEYDADGLSKIGVTLRYIDDELSFNDDVITDLLLEVRPERIIVEYNGMWNISRPKVIWDPEQILEIMMIDASTFENYLGNLKAVIADQIRSADLIIFGRCDEVADSLSMYRRSCRALNRNANIVFRNDDGEISFDPAVRVAGRKMLVIQDPDLHIMLLRFIQHDIHVMPPSRTAEVVMGPCLHTDRTDAAFTDL